MAERLSLVHGALGAVWRRLAPRRYKHHRELSYWSSRVQLESVLTNEHFAFFYTGYFGLEADFYRGKRILDIGCGPRGSLEWADMAAERVGLDPLADRYLGLGAKGHRMRYLRGSAEAIPFADGHFDVVCSFNSLDHVDDYFKVIAEVKRVVKPGGLFLLIVEANHPAMVTEPVTVGWEDLRLFEDAFDVVSARCYEIGDGDIYGQLRRNDVFDESRGNGRPGFLAAKLSRKHAQGVG